MMEVIADNMKKHNNLTVGIMDSTKNEIPETEIKNYPTFILFKPDNKDFEKYDGPRKRKLITQFLVSSVKQIILDSEL